MKKLVTAALAAAMTVALAVPALGAAGKYAYTVTVNGEKLDTSSLPAISQAAVPLRAVAEADHGFADWYPEENLCMAVMDGNSINADTTTHALTVNDEAVKGMTATFLEGVTYVPATVLNKLPGYSVTVSGKSIAITTPNGAKLTKLAYSILDQVQCGATMKHSAAQMEEYYGIKADNFEEVVGFFPFNTNPDTLILGKVKAGKLDAVKEQFEAYRQKQEDTFSWYLVQHLDAAKNGQVVTKGDYVCCVIADDADEIIKLFKAGV